MLRTLDRYILSELLKVMLLTTAVIVVVIAFGSAIKPLAENLLGPGGTAKYIALATVPMLQFAIPFAGGFAATLVLHRFAADNEIVAMACCGISYRRILAPVLGLGVVLMLVMFLLVNFAVPRFWTLLKQVLAQDVTAAFETMVERGEAFPIGRTSIFADAVQPAEAPPGADKRLLLAGVAAVEADGDGRPQTEFTSESAAVDVYRRGKATWMKLAMTNATVFRAKEGTVLFVPQAMPDAMMVDRGISRGPKFLSLPELMELSAELDSRPDAFERRRAVDLVLAKQGAWGCLASQLEHGGRATLEDESNRREYVVEGGVVRESGISPRGPGGRVTVTEYERGVATRRAVTERVDVYFDDETPPDETPRFDLALSSPEVTDLRSREATRTRWPARIPALQVRGCVARSWSELGNQAAVEMAEEIPETGPGPAADLSRLGREAAASLKGEVQEVRQEIASHLSQRAAQSLSAPLILLLGAVLAIWRRHSLPLVIYLLAFAPAVGNILMVAGGQQMMRGGSMVLGSAVMWAGSALLLVATLGAYRALARN